jgi:chromosome segregation ATPase
LIAFFVITEETEKLRAELTKVRTELEPWENQIIEHKGRLDVASAEKELMKQKVWSSPLTSLYSEQ